MHFHTKVRQ